MKNRTGPGLIILGYVLVLAGCATHGAHTVDTTPMMQAREEIPEEQLLDVGIVTFNGEELTEEEAKDQGTHPDIRKAERHFIPYHLKNTLQQSSYWGAVRVVPTDASRMDLLVHGEIIESNGEHLVLKVQVVDASGKTWLEEAYEARATEFSYSENVPAKKDVFQDLYNTVANDMVAYKKQLSPSKIQDIRTISQLEFAADFAPDAFGGYLARNERGEITISRLPAGNDSMMARLLEIRERDHMFTDMLDDYYDQFYYEMWPAYENWREANLIEQTALRKIKRDAAIRQTAGILLTALAVGLGIGGVDGAAFLSPALIVAGGAVFVNGMNISKEAEIHRMAIQELSDSFGSEMEPFVMEFEGKQYELTGSAEEQYRRWRELLREIYYTETGYGRADETAIDNPSGN